jgi:uncharacterized peroxidase-related enzyme
MMQYTIHSVASAPDASRHTLASAQRSLGFVPNLLAVMAEAPALLQAYVALDMLFDKTSLTPSERQVVLLSVSYQNDCEYCVAAHTVIAAMQKVPSDVVESIRAGRPIADPRLEALPRFTARVVTSRGMPSPAETRAFLDAGYSKAQALEVILGIGMKTLSNYTNHIADTPIDDAFAAAVWSKAA